MEGLDKVLRRLTGLLRTSPRGPILETGEGEIWRLDTEDDLASMIGHEVIAEGTVQGVDRLALLWIGPKATSHAA
jgi:hypothetical protein